MSITPARGEQNGNCCHFVENLLYDPKTDPVGGHWDYNYKGSGVDGWGVYPDGTAVPKFDKQRVVRRARKDVVYRISGDNTSRNGDNTKWK